MIGYFITGATLGLTAGISPGPLMTLVIAESLRGGWPAGFRIALAPLVTDTVLVSIALLLIAPMPGWGLALIGVAGGAVMIWMGWGTIQSSAPVVQAATAATAQSGRWGLLGKGIVTNLLNPHAFLFWVTIGGPLLREAYGTVGWPGPAAFMAPFLLLLIAAKMLLALGVSSGRRFLQGPAYRWSLGAAGAALGLLGLWQIWKGAQFFL